MNCTLSSLGTFLAGLTSGVVLAVIVVSCIWKSR